MPRVQPAKGPATRAYTTLYNGVLYVQRNTVIAYYSQLYCTTGHFDCVRSSKTHRNTQKMMENSNHKMNGEK